MSSTICATSGVGTGMKVEEDEEDAKRSSFASAFFGKGNDVDIGTSLVCRCCSAGTSRICREQRSRRR